MKIRATLEPDAKAAEPVQPGEGPLHDPPLRAQPAPVLGTSMWEVRADPSSLHLLAVRLRVVGAIAVDRVGPLPRSPRLARQGGDRIDQGDELGDVVPVGWREENRERDATRVCDDVVLAPGTAPIDGTGSCLFPPRPSPERARSPRPLGTSRSCPRRAAAPAARGAASPTRPPPASRAAASST